MKFPKVSIIFVISMNSYTIYDSLLPKIEYIQLKGCFKSYSHNKSCKKSHKKTIKLFTVTSSLYTGRQNKSSTPSLHHEAWFVNQVRISKYLLFGKNNPFGLERTRALYWWKTKHEKAHWITWACSGFRKKPEHC